MPAAVRSTRRGFGRQWLAARLAQLLPQFPRCALCVAFSGGADSTALLAALAQLSRPALKVRALHIDHGLNPRARAWSRHCAQLARALGVPLSVRRLRVRRVRGESLEAAARAARYAAFAAALKPGEILLTAHHEDDQLETVLLQLLRGAGVAGLAAMPAMAPLAHGMLVRPLLPVAHAELVAWLRRRALPWIEDDSNALLQLDRNYLRVRVVPLIRVRWPSAAATVSRSARHAAEAQRLLDALAAADVARAAVGARLSAAVLRTLTPQRRRNALRFWIAAAGHLNPPTRVLTELAGPLLAARPDSQPCVAWERALVQRQGGLLSLRTQAPPGPAPQGSAPQSLWHWREQPRWVLPAALGTLKVRPEARGPLDLDALASPLTVRLRRGGERLRPVRGGPRRALKGLLQEARVPVTQRARLPLLFAGEQLVAVAGLWLDESVQAHPHSARRGRISWSGAQPGQDA